MAWPIMNADASEQSQMTPAAISSGGPIRPTGSSAITLARPSGAPPLKRPIIGVSMYPGQIALIRMLRRVVESRRSGEAEHPVLRGGVRGAPLDADDTCTRGGVDDCAASLLQDQRDLVLHAEEHAAQIDVEYPVPLLLLVLGGRRRLPRLNACDI